MLPLSYHSRLPLAERPNSVELESGRLADRNWGFLPLGHSSPGPPSSENPYFLRGSYFVARPGGQKQVGRAHCRFLSLFSF